MVGAVDVSRSPSTRPATFAAVEAFPEQGRAFAGSVIAGPDELDGAGRVHLASISSWLQDIAFLDVIDSGLVGARAWVVRKTAFEIASQPEFGERLTIRTACSGFAASVAERRTSISGDRGASIEAVATWVLVDPENRMPMRLDKAFTDLYGPSAAGRRAKAKLHHQPPPADGEKLDWHFAAADIDVAGHVNNTVYWKLGEEFLPASNRYEIEFRAGIGAGPAEIIREGRALWVLAPGDAVAASIVAG